MYIKKNGWTIRSVKNHYIDKFYLSGHNPYFPNLVIIWEGNPGEICYWDYEPEYADLEAFGEYLEKHLKFEDKP